MLIVCPSCASEYMIEPAQIGADGRMVRCAACRDTFFVAGEPELTEEELAEATDDWRRDKLSHKVDQLRALQAELR